MPAISFRINAASESLLPFFLSWLKFFLNDVVNYNVNNYNVDLKESL